MPSALRSVLAASLALACGGPGTADAGLDGGSGATAVFDLGALTDGVVTSVPFPSDLYLDEAGEIALGPIPGVRDRAAFDGVRELVRRRGGLRDGGGR